MPSPASHRIRATFRPAVELPDLSIDEQRRGWEAAAAQVPLPPAARCEPVVYDGVACAWVRFPGADDGALILLHGGGFSAGSALTHRDLGARLAQATNLPVLLVEYRLAPEHPFPAGLDDAVTVYRALLADGYAAERLIMCGDSAGGGLAVATLLALRDAQVPLPRAAVLLSAWLDLALGGELLVSRAQLDPLTTRAGLAAAAQLYVGQRDATDPFISPVYGELAGLPPLLLQVGDHEMLLDDSRRLAERARAAGVEATLEVWPEMWHVWHGWAAELPEGQAAIDQIGAYVQQILR